MMISPVFKPAFSAALSFVTFDIFAPGTLLLSLSSSIVSVVTPKKAWGLSPVPLKLIPFINSPGTISNALFPLLSQIVIFLLLMVIFSSLNSDRGFPLIVTLSPFTSTVILASLSVFVRMMISCDCLFLSFSFWIIFSFFIFSSCANAVLLKAIKPNTAALKSTFFIYFIFMYEIFSRSNVERIFELRNLSHIIFWL